MGAPPSSVTSYKEQMMEALNEGTQVKTNVSAMDPYSPTSMLPPPPQQAEPTVCMEAPPTVAGYRDKMMEALNGSTAEKKNPFAPPAPPPPSFDVVEMHQQQETKSQQPVAPPSFEAIEHNMMDKTVIPSAPPVEPAPVDLLSG